MFKKYRKSAITEIRPYVYGEPMDGIPINDLDKKNGSPQMGDMIARDATNPKDQWLISETYFRANYEEVR
jgi:hypothetical protein